MIQFSLSPKASPVTVQCAVRQALQMMTWPNPFRETLDAMIAEQQPPRGCHNDLEFTGQDRWEDEGGSLYEGTNYKEAMATAAHHQRLSGREVADRVPGKSEVSREEFNRLREEQHIWPYGQGSAT